MDTPPIAFWSSASGNTARFVSRINLPAARIANGGEPLMMSGPFILITPTFADASGRGAVPKPVIRFLNQERNRSLLVGVAGSGNRNFGPMFGIGAKVCAHKCGVPLVHLFELAGEDNDVEIIRKAAMSAAS